jgi:hypothetical protein
VMTRPRNHLPAHTICVQRIPKAVGIIPNATAAKVRAARSVGSKNADRLIAYVFSG